MKHKTIPALEARIKMIQKELSELGDLRPGSLSKQHKDPGPPPRRPFFQLSYTHKMKSRSEYIKAEFVPEIRKQIATYNKLKALVQEWIDIGIELSRLRMRSH